MEDFRCAKIQRFEDCRSISNRIFRDYLFQDKRFNKRVISISSRLLQSPGVPFQQTFSDWGQSKGFYRFVSNKRVTLSDIGEPIYTDGVIRCGTYPKVYAIMDTTEVSLPATAIREEYGPISKNIKTRGFFIHTTMALTPKGLPIGLLDQLVWSRDKDDFGKKHTRKERPIEEKESYKWLASVENTTERFRRILGTKKPSVVFIGDRESDIHELFEDLSALKEQGIGGIIRAQWNRRITEGPKNLRDYVESREVAKKITIDVPRKPGEEARKAVLSIRYAEEVTLAPRKDKYPDRKQVRLSVVSAIEENPPSNVDEESVINWLILTTEKVTCAEEALKIIRLYKMRWRIEDFHFILKSGCRVEKYQFETPERYYKVALLMSLVALELLRLTYMGRIHPYYPATAILSEIQIKVMITKLRIRDGPDMTISDAIKYIGRMGGHLGRKSDGPPGVKTLWRGWRDLQILVDYTIAMQDIKND